MLAKEHNAALDTIKRAVGEITREDDPDTGHSADAVYEGHSADTLLSKLAISVVDEGEGTA